MRAWYHEPVSLVGTTWEFVGPSDDNDRLVLVLRQVGEEVVAFYLLHTDPAWAGAVFPYPVKHLLNPEVWQRVA